MSFVKRIIKDRVVQYPHRYDLVPIEGYENRYDIVQVPGTITELGTPINKDLLQRYENRISELDNMSYLAFCINANADGLDAAFGKGNEDRVTGIGRQLAMYAWFKGDNKLEYPFTNLVTCDTLQDILNNTNALNEVYINVNVLNIIGLSPYAGSLFVNAIVGSDIALKTICMNASASGTYRTLLQPKRSSIVTALNASSLFTKASVTYTGTGTTTLSSGDLETNTIIIPTESPAQNVGMYGERRGNRFVYYGADKTKIWEVANQRLDAIIPITTGVSLRGIYFQQNYDIIETSQKLTCDVYTAI